MHTLESAELLGFVELKVGSLAVQVPIRSAVRPANDGPETVDTVDKESEETAPLASFATEGDACAILVRGDASSARVERAVRDAAAEAVKHLSRKLLN